MMCSARDREKRKAKNGEIEAKAMKSPRDKSRDKSRDRGDGTSRRNDKLKNAVIASQMASNLASSRSEKGDRSLRGERRESSKDKEVA